MDYDRTSFLCNLLDSGKCLEDKIPAFEKKFKK